MKRSAIPKLSGVVLVIVLAFLVLISSIIVAFLTSVSAELNSSKATATSSTSQQLANSAVNVVMAQLVDGTKGTQNGLTAAWASQPGMIRTFGSGGGKGTFYKLYSSDQMTVAGDSFQLDKEIPPNDWNSDKYRDLYTDLNAPAKNKEGDFIYPIIDPSVDPNWNGSGTNTFKIDSFTVQKPPGFKEGEGETVTNNHAPMPVKWLYVLKDGTLIPGSEASESGVKVEGATKLNPIVGRIAFWTDDETSKVNINTASEGTYWDVPRAYSYEDFGAYSGNKFGLAISQPARFEYQRYPGHPATTSLSPIFGALFKTISPWPANPTAAQGTTLDPYYNLTPRIGLLKGGGGGGSKGGSFQVSKGASLPLLDTERLYASVDDLMFSSPQLYTPVTDAPTTRSLNAAPSSATTPTLITKSVLSRARFFLTANSVAPEVTLFNTPRVAVWPVATQSGNRTAYDSLLAFCSTIGGKGYYFTRSSARSGSSDYTGRNVELYKYLQELTKTNIPGFGGNFQAKYPADSSNPGPSDCDQILTYIYDYIRCTNLQDQSQLPSGNPVTPYTPLFTGSSVTNPAGEVVPIRIGQTQGFGRFYSVTSANLLFYATHVDPSKKVDRMRALFFLGFTTPMQGLACMRSNMTYTVKGLDQFRFDASNGAAPNWQSLNLPPGGTNYMDRSDLSLYHGRSVGGTESPWQAIVGKPFADGDSGGNAPGRYPFFSASDVNVAGSGGTFRFTSADPVDPNGKPREITVEIRSKDTNQLVQTLHFAFPSGQFKVPPGIVGSGKFGDRTGGDYNSLVNANDTLVALEVGGFDRATNAGSGAAGADQTAGDIRMTASLIDVPANRFRPDNDYKVSGVQFAHSLVQSVGEPFQGAKYGKLALNVGSYKQATPVAASNIARQPDVPSRVTTGVTRRDGGPGDWDTGFGDQKDGAYINKPDEGDTALTDITNGQTRLPYSLGYGAGFASATNTYFSPNRQIPSPLMFGSIPTGVQRMLPWQTLLFHPRPEDSTHPGKQDPKDHLLADLFWMPVVEPWAISQPFATTGKINLNYQIMPFTYIKRQTAMYALMKSTKFAALDPKYSTLYKPLDAAGKGTTPTMPNIRLAIDMVQTLQPFETKFAKNEIFRSASEICEMNLVPSGEKDSSMAAFWKKNTLTGDNLREKPYVDLYSRITTKSNTYTVHVRVQTLQKVTGTPPDVWNSARDQVLGEYRGSTIIERYIDLNDPNLPDFATRFSSNPADPGVRIDQYYKMRVVSTKRFAP